MSADSSKMSDPHRFGPPEERTGAEDGLFFETDVVRLPPEGRELMRGWGRGLADVLRRSGGFDPRVEGPLGHALEALRQDARRLEAFASRVAAGADEREALAGLLRASGFLLRRLVRELDEGLGTGASGGPGPG